MGERVIDFSESAYNQGFEYAIQPILTNPIICRKL